MRVRFLLALLLSTAPAALAEDGAAERRVVIALVEGTMADAAIENAVHQVLELPLNHLGMVVKHHYIRNGPPPAEWLEDARAVLTYFPGDGAAPDWLWPWLEKEVPEHNLRVIHFGEFGPLLRPDDARLRKWLRGFGLEYDDGYAAGAWVVEAGFLDKKICTFEADPRAYAIHHGPKNTGARNRVWVTTRRRSGEADPRTPVVTGPWGGIALDPWTVRLGTDDEDRRWFLDPFLFFKEALGLERVPAPHPSVLNGRRMWILQIDGDGFESLSTIRRNALCARVMLDNVLKRYRLPFTVSIVVRSLTPDYDVEEPTKEMLLAREILNLPFVEPASHGILHTLNWQPEHVKTEDERDMWYPGLKNYTYSTVAEVSESIRFVNERLMEKGRRCRMMLWTGSANPLEPSILAADAAGCTNINGGIFRWDEWTDSVGFVTPWSRVAGRGLQVYAGAANENVFEGFFDTMPGSFGIVDTTIERTGSPRILKPADIYIHFYSAANPPRLNAVHDLIRRWAFEEPTAPVFASAYSKAVISAVRSAKIRRTARGWLLRDFGDCRTARIDGEPRDVDWTASSGLLGARRLDGSLYLHLAAGDARVVLADAPAPHPHVEEANCLLTRARLTPHGVSLVATAHNPRVIVLAGFLPSAALSVRLDDEESDRKADATGRLRIELAEPGTTRIAVRVTESGPAATAKRKG